MRRVRTVIWALVAVVALAAVVAVVTDDSGSQRSDRSPTSAASGGPPPRPCPPHDGPTDPSVVGDAEIGEPLPAVTMPTVDGCTVSLSDYEGTPLVIPFGASWCQPCYVEWPALVAEMEARPGQFDVLAVNFREALADDTVAFLDEVGAPWQAIDDDDGEVAQAFGVRTVPTTFFVDADGVVRDRIFGADADTIAEAIDALLEPSAPGS